MKVLFAVSNESISESIVKKYQKDYKEIISYKNVYYFNAILKEIERDKSYDRIVISEDLEPFANNNYETIDRFLFEKLDSVSDEASNGEGNDIPIILICTDRRSKSDSILVKLFSIGIYNAMIGVDRSIDEVCQLINKPRSKKEAKIYYKIDVEDANYEAENEENVSEAEIQNIIAHYKKLGKNTDRFVDSFNNIASQYTDQQLKIITKFLPLNVKAVLEAESPKYQEIMAYNGKKKRGFSAPISYHKGDTTTVKPKKVKVPKIEDLKIDLLEDNERIHARPDAKNIIVPSAINTKSAKPMKEEVKPTSVARVEPEPIVKSEPEPAVQETIPEPVAEQPVKRRRGRPRKVKPEETVVASKAETSELDVQPISPIPETKQVEVEEPVVEQPVKRKRGRPRKVKPVEETVVEKPVEPQPEPTPMQEESEPEEVKPLDLFNMPEDEDDDGEFEASNTYQNREDTMQRMQAMTNTAPSSSIDVRSLLTRDKKVVCFVGTSKNGTSFIINNLAYYFAQMGINTAILDTTKNKNSYYIYTKNEENLRKKAFECMDKLEQGIAAGIEVSRNLTVYTDLPGKTRNSQYVDVIVSTLIHKHSVILVDCDFDTADQYFVDSQEIYLVQSMDVLTIQPLTAFLRDLKTRNVLDAEKLRVVINKELKVKGLSPKTLIGGMSFYNEPAMTFMTELFNKDTIKYCSIPFETENYEKYLEAIVDCNISINSYSKNFLPNLKNLGDLVYPLVSNNTYGRMDNKYNFQNNGYEERTKKKGFFKMSK